MTKIKNLSKENLKQIAEDVNGKLWTKGDKTRIYVTGGNNYQYEGSWYFDIDDAGNWESKCYLTQGYSNKNREEYVNKYLGIMSEEMEAAISDAIVEGIDLSLSDDEKKSMREYLESDDEKESEEEEEYQGEDANFGDNKYEYPTNFYNGCGSYYLALKDGKIIASVNFTSDMERSDKGQCDFFKKQVAEKGFEDVKIMPADGSGTTFFARGWQDVTDLKTKEYWVPKAGGGKHKNIELIFE